jgi:selenocysteine lyase/cysteine desulfurase/tRNA(Ile)-lysidine synthase TilS/MesJ
MIGQQRPGCGFIKNESRKKVFSGGPSRLFLRKMDRHFSLVLQESDSIRSTDATATKIERRIATLRENIIGSYDRFNTPFGDRPIVYADWTASGRLLRNVEDYVIHEVATLYGNTHTTTSITGYQSSSYRHEARQILAEATNAKVTGHAAEDIVLFVGNGTTGAINKLILALGLHISVGNSDINTPIVFTSSYEHHSNLLPWRESIAEVATIKYSAETGVCLKDLKEKLLQYSHRKVKIGAFSAASNVTGVLTAVDDVSILMHRHGGIVVYDYATASPYVKMDMNPYITRKEDQPYVYKDAIVFSGHKWLGGPGTQGVLIVKKTLMPAPDELPTTPGGGTVFYVADGDHRYLSNKEEREEGGTANVVGDIKLGLVVHIKQSIGAEWIEQEEVRIAKYVLHRLTHDSGCENVVILGHDQETSSSRYLPIFSFLVKCGDRFLHYNLVCALLNDLFGIQSRGGCQCAGPFAQYLLGITNEYNKAFQTALLDKQEVLRPGFTRLSFPYWLAKEEIDYTVNAILCVATHGYKFLPLYRFNHKSGEWAHATRINKFVGRKWITNFSLDGEVSAPNSSDQTGSDHATIASASTAGLASVLRSWAVSDVAALLSSMAAAVADICDHVRDYSAGSTSVVSAIGCEELRWFALPNDAKSGKKPDILAINPGIHQLPHASQATELTPFAAQRNDVLKLRQGGEGIAEPRYAKLFHVDRAVGDGKVVKEKEILVENTDAKPVDDHQSESVECSTGVCGVRRVLPPLEGTMERLLDGNLNIQSFDGRPPATPLKLLVPPKKLMRAVGQAIGDWKMIKDGDRLLLGLSGGKDSLALLHILLALKKKAPVKFELACATIDPQTESFDPSPLIPYVQSLGVTYHYLSEPIVEMAKTKLQGDSLCAFCSRFKRGFLYSCCRKYDYNKLVLAQHLDDLAESFFMSTMHNGAIRTMKANYQINEGDIEVIRPLVYTREELTRDFSVQNHLPIINENCPACFENPKERARIKKLLVQEESMYPSLFQNFKRAFIPLMDQSIYPQMAAINERVAQVSIDRTLERNCVPPSSKEKIKRKRCDEKGVDEKEEQDGDASTRLRSKPFVVSNTSDFDR